MKTKHTPGPCPRCKEGRRLNELIFLCACGPKPDGSWTKHTYLASQYPAYAAAPELLEACRGFVALFAGDHETWWTELHANVYNSAVAAIAKAEEREG